MAGWRASVSVYGPITPHLTESGMNMIKTSMYEKVIKYADDFQMSTTEKKNKITAWKHHSVGLNLTLQAFRVFICQMQQSITFPIAQSHAWVTSALVIMSRQPKPNCQKNLNVKEVNESISQHN